MPVWNPEVDIVFICFREFYFFLHQPCGFFSSLGILWRYKWQRGLCTDFDLQTSNKYTLQVFVTDPAGAHSASKPREIDSGFTPTSYQEQEHFKCDFCFLILALCFISSHLSRALSPQLGLGADEGLQRTSRRGPAVIWVISKQLWNTSSGEGPEQKQCWWPWFSWPRMRRLLLIIPAFLCNTNKSFQETVEKWKLSGISFLVV